MIGFYHYNGKSIYMRYKSVIHEWLREVAKREGRELGDISIVMCVHQEHLQVNLKYLHHNFYTDVITFDDSNPDTLIVDGDILIDKETVRENTHRFKTRYNRELLRVIVHGVLHLCGQTDKLEMEERIMHKKEDRYLLLYDELLAAHKERESKKKRLVGHQAKRENERRAKLNLPPLEKDLSSQKTVTDRRHNRGNCVYNGAKHVRDESRVVSKDAAKGKMIGKDRAKINMGIRRGPLQ